MKSSFNKDSDQINIEMTDKLANLERFKAGVTMKGKLFGVEDVKKEAGDEICQDAMIKLKAIIAVKKEHKQKLTIKINLEGIELESETSSEILYKHNVNRISYIARDLKDARALGYIYKNQDDSYQYFGLRTEKPAQEVFNCLRDLFETCLDLKYAEKAEKTGENKSESKAVVDEKPREEIKEKTEEKVFKESDKARLISEGEPETPAPVSEVKIPEVKTPEVEVAKAEEPSLFDLSSDLVEPAKPASAMDDLFGLGDLSLDVGSTPQVPANTPSTFQGNNDLFSMMNAPAQSPQVQYNQQNSFQGMSTMTNMNGMANMSSQFSPIANLATNPFNNAFATNNMNGFQQQQQQQQQTRAAPVPPKNPAPAPKVNTNAFDDLFN